MILGYNIHSFSDFLLSNWVHWILEISMTMIHDSWILFSFDCLEDPNCTEQPTFLRRVVFKNSLGLWEDTVLLAVGTGHPDPSRRGSKYCSSLSIFSTEGLKLGVKGTLRWIALSKEVIGKFMNAEDRETVGNSMTEPLRKPETVCNTRDRHHGGCSEERKP